MVLISSHIPLKTLLYETLSLKMTTKYLKFTKVCKV